MFFQTFQNKFFSLRLFSEENLTEMDRKIIILILLVVSTIAQNIPAVTPAFLLGTLAKTSKYRSFICFLDRQELGSGANFKRSAPITWFYRFFEIQKLGSHIMPQNYQNIWLIKVVSIRVKSFVKHPKPLPELLGSLFRKLYGLELDGNEIFSTSSRHGLKKYFPFFF